MPDLLPASVDEVRAGAHLQVRPDDFDDLAGVLAGQLSPNTQRAYDTDLRCFLAWVASDAGGEAVLDRELARRYRTFLVGRYKASTVNRRLTTLRVLCAELVERGRLPRNPLNHLPGFRLANESPLPVLTRPMALDLLGAARSDPTPRGVRDYALLLLALWTGLRKSELLALRTADLAVEGDHVVMWYTGKGNKRRRTKILKPLERALRAWVAELERCSGRAPEATEPLWRQVHGPRSVPSVLSPYPWRVEAAALSKTGLDDLLVKRCKAAGLTPITPHSLRATFVTLALEIGAPNQRVQHAAGHNDSRTTDRYNRQREAIVHHAVDYLGFLGALEAEDVPAVNATDPTAAVA